MDKWVLIAKRSDFQKTAARFGIDPLTARLIRNRDAADDRAVDLYLNGKWSDAPSPHLLQDMDKAVSCLKEAVRSRKRIRIIGDYDVDGVSASYILLEGLKRAGACVDVCIPHRITDGYGIHEGIIRKAYEEQVDLLLTCDNGISAAAEAKLAAELRMQLIITDHHEIPYRTEDGIRVPVLPVAEAVINPHREDSAYPEHNICGAVVAFKLIQCLYEAMGVPAKEAEKFLEIAAIATIGDVMELQGENRWLVKEGLLRLENPANRGIRALKSVCGLENMPVNSYHVGFILGPCINASGRLESAYRSLALLCAETDEEAYQIALELRELNEERKRLTEEGRDKAHALIENTELGKDKVLVIYLENCHESVAGIIAGRVREEYHKPVFILTDGEKCLKGSGRSIEAYSMFEKLSECAELLERFGGHPMAAGLSIKKENLEAFRRRINENCNLGEDDLVRKVRIDAAMPFSYITRELIGEFSLLEPFGKGNPKPVFARKNVILREPRILGANKNVLKMKALDEEGIWMECIYFGDPMPLLALMKQRERIHITYFPEINTFRDTSCIQIVIQNYC